MKSYTSNKVKIKHYNSIFQPTVKLYREAVDFFLLVALQEWEAIGSLNGIKRNNQIEKLTIQTKQNPEPAYPFPNQFYKFPCYLRRAAIGEAIGMVSSYQSNLANWEKDRTGRKPSIPQAGYSMPAMYRQNCFIMTGTYTAKIKVFIRNTWDWLEVAFRKFDIDYIHKYCSHRKDCVPTLQKIGKQWFLRFSFEEEIKLDNIPIQEQRILSVDLGINNA